MLTGQFLELYNLLKNRLVKGRGITVSPVGLADGCKLPNDGAMFGPDTSGTKTCGINEAIAAAYIELPGLHISNISIGNDNGSLPVQLCSGTYTIEDTIVLAQGVMLIGNGRASTFIRLPDTPSTSVQDMVCMISIPDGANLSSVRHLSLSGSRTEPYWPYNIHGIQLAGYLWRPFLEDLEIVNCQGAGINFTGGDNNKITYEPLITNVSIQSCNWAGIIMTYCADDVLYSVNIENCSGEGIRYYGGNGKWFDVHAYLNEVGFLLSGRPLRISSCSLDTNKKEGARVLNNTDTNSPGATVFLSPMAQGNGINGSGATASAIVIDAGDCIITDMVALNKPADPYQEHAVYRVNPSNTSIIIGDMLCYNLLGSNIV